MSIPPDIEIAQNATLAPITDVAAKLRLRSDEVIPYGFDKAKVSPGVMDRLGGAETAKTILVSAMTATRAGDGKTVTSIGLAQAMGKLGVNHALCLRQPSLGPTFGIKGGAAGGGYSQVLPMEDINMHLTGDFHAITYANNLLAAVLDNSVYFDNPMDLDPERLVWRRVIDLCDRQLRNCEIGRGGPKSGFVHSTGFDITAASEVMAVLALARDGADLDERLGRMVVAYDRAGNPKFARDLECIGAMRVLMKDALAPNLVQTIEHTPVLMHCGPFANIAHGCNSVLATTMGQKLADWVVTEAGFAADLGGEKFMHIKCRALGHMPAATVLVVTARALKLHGGADAKDLKNEDVEALERGFANPRHHVTMMRKFGVPVVVAINRFPHDTDAELAAIRRLCDELQVPAAISEVCARGGEGGIEFAEVVMEAAKDGNRPLAPLYETAAPLRSKIETVAREVYGADGVEWEDDSETQLDALEEHGFGGLPVCMAKTQLSISDDPKKKGAPTGWRLRVRGAKVSNGAGFVVVYTGKVLLMPGMPRAGAALNIGMDGAGRIHGLS